MNKIPIKITPCPILEAVVEVRFETTLPSEAVFGILYSKLCDQYKSFEKLPVLQIPESIRNQDPNFKYQPSHRLIDDNFYIQIGSNVISIVNANSYVGWENFSVRIKSALNHLIDSKITTNIVRFGIRYINFFDLDIFSKINFKFTLNESPFETKQLVLGSLLSRNEFLANLQIANNTLINETSLKGSIVDIDIYTDNPNLDLFEILNNGHQEEKRLFFELLNEDFIDSLSPQY